VLELPALSVGAAWLLLLRQPLHLLLPRQQRPRQQRPAQQLLQNPLPMTLTAFWAPVLLPLSLLLLHHLLLVQPVILLAVQYVSQLQQAL
jgi:hypothetical protein